MSSYFLTASKILFYNSNVQSYELNYITGVMLLILQVAIMQVKGLDPFYVPDKARGPLLLRMMFGCLSNASVYAGLLELK